MHLFPGVGDSCLSSATPVGTSDFSSVQQLWPTELPATTEMSLSVPSTVAAPATVAVSSRNAATPTKERNSASFNFH